MKYGMAIDTRKCVACGACVIACKTEHDTPEGFSRSWLTEVSKGTYPDIRLELRSERCQHCENPPCVSNCPTDASHIGKGGIVVVDDKKCIGCGACITSCPYDARYFTPKGKVDKCTFCEERVFKGDNPACVDACPTHCMTFGDLDNPESDLSKLVEKREWKALKPHAGTKPKIYYLV